MRNPYRARFHAVGYTLATSVPPVMPLCRGMGSCCESPVPALSTGTGYFRRSSRGPGRVEGWGEMRRGQRGAGFRRIRISHVDNKATMLIPCLSASRQVRQGCTQRVRPATPSCQRRPHQHARGVQSASHSARAVCVMRELAKPAMIARVTLCGFRGFRPARRACYSGCSACAGRRTATGRHQASRPY
jgi:hypothetical protein